MTRYVIIGAGAVGGALAGLLADVGVDVVAVARGANAEAIRDRGITVRLPDRTVGVTVRCVTGPDDLPLTVDDVLVLSTKTHQAEAALQAWVDTPVTAADGSVVGTAGEVLPIVTALNGVASEELALRRFDRVIGACVWTPAVHLEPGEVIVRATPTRGTFHLGPYPAGRDESAVLDAIERDWTAAGFRIQRPADVMPWKYRKLIDNIGNAFTALVGRSAPVRELVTAAQDEARAVLAQAGIEIVSDAEEAAEREQGNMTIQPVPGEPERVGGSSWQSLARGTGDIETDYLNGEIALVARRTGTTAPINATITRLARRAAATGRRPGELTPDELRAVLPR